MSEASRAALEAAFDLHSEENTDEENTTATAAEPGTVDEGTASAIDDAVGVTKIAAERPAKVRDEGGKFTKAGEKQTTEPVLEDKPVVEATAQTPPGDKPTLPPAQPVQGPQSWKPELRAKFGKLDPDVQQEVLRRDREVGETLRQTSEQRQYATRVNDVIAPYRTMIRAEGGDDVSAIDALMKTAYHLRTAPPHVKANLVAQMITQHGIDPEMLNEAWNNARNGQQQRIAQDPMAQYFQQQMAPVQQFMQTFTQAQQQAQQNQQQTVQNEYNLFANDPKNEYFGDVAPIMADFIEAAAKQGQKMTLQDAYTRATLAHPTISQLVINKRMSATATQRQAVVTRAKAASASLPSGGAPAEGTQIANRPKTTRSAVEAAWDEIEARET